MTAKCMFSESFVVSMKIDRVRERDRERERDRDRDRDRDCDCVFCSLNNKTRIPDRPWSPE